MKEEIRRLKRRRQLHLGEKGMDLEGGYESPTSPQNSTTHGIYSPISSVSNQPSPSNKDKALFTFKQVSSCFYSLSKLDSEESVILLFESLSIYFIICRLLISYNMQLTC